MSPALLKIGINPVFDRHREQYTHLVEPIGSRGLIFCYDRGKKATDFIKLGDVPLRVENGPEIFFFTTSQGPQARYLSPNGHYYLPAEIPVAEFDALYERVSDAPAAILFSGLDDLRLHETPEIQRIVEQRTSLLLVDILKRRTTAPSK